MRRKLLLKILWITNIPSPYRVDFFNELGMYCDLKVLFEKNKSSEREDNWGNSKFVNFDGIFMKGKSYSVDKAICLEVIKYIKNNNYDHIIVTDFASITGVIAIEYMKAHNISYCIESDGGFSKEGNGFKEKFKKHLIKGAKTYFSTANSSDNYYLTYGAKKENIYRYPFTSIHDMDILEKPNTRAEKEKIKNKLGIKEEKVILSVGQFIYRKGFDVLLHACQNLKDNIGVYIVGGDPKDEYLQLQKDLELKNVHFVKFKNKEALKEYYKAADVFVLPTREDIWGLVINEAMANGLPVVTTDKCIAGLELVKNGINGYIIPVNNSEELADKMNTVINNPCMCKIMAENNLKVIKNYTIKTMAQRHIEILGEIRGEV